MPRYSKFSNFFEFLKDPYKVQLLMKPEYRVKKGGASFKKIFWNGG
jgi:CTP:phosphocholine cytidylyltransferase-like protein